MRRGNRAPRISRQLEAEEKERVARKAENLLRASMDPEAGSKRIKLWGVDLNHEKSELVSTDVLEKAKGSLLRSISSGEKSGGLLGGEFLRLQHRRAILPRLENSR